MYSAPVFFNSVIAWDIRHFIFGCRIRFTHPIIFLNLDKSINTKNHAYVVKHNFNHSKSQRKLETTSAEHDKLDEAIEAG